MFVDLFIDRNSQLVYSVLSTVYPEDWFTLPRLPDFLTMGSN